MAKYQKKRKMSIYVVSTSGYNKRFMKTRKNIFKLIDEDLKMTPLGYELTSFAIIPGVSLSENCKLNMQAADLFLVLINERYGYSEPGEDKSITHIEIEEVLNSQKPYIVFLQNDLMDTIDYMESPNISETFLDNEHICWQKQIQLIRNVASYCPICKFPKNNVRETCNIIREKIISLAPFFIKQYIDKQLEYVQALASNTWYNTHTEKVPVLYKISGNNTSDNLTNACVELLNNTSVFIEGECGSGKSFWLREVFIDRASHYSRNASWSNERIPIFLEFKSYKNEKFNAKQYVKDSFIEHMGYKAPAFIIDKILNQGLLIVGDAIDEWQYAHDQQMFCTMISSLGSKFVISARRSTYRRFSVDVASIFCTVISIYGWLAEDLQQYAKSCWGSLERIEHLETILNACETKLISSQSHTIKYYPPLVASIAIQCLAKDELAPNQIANIGKLFREATTSCIKREYQKRRLTCTEDILFKGKQFLSKVCLFVFLSGSQNKNPALLQDLYEYFDEISYTVTDTEKDILLPLFFFVQENYFYPQHMMIVYYYVAEEAIRMLQKGDYSIFSCHSIPSEINRMIGDFYTDVSAFELENIFNRLCNHLTSIDDEVSKLLLYYFIPRLAIGTNKLKNQVTNFLRISLENETGFARISILNWLTQLGDTEAENKYYNLIKNDIAFSQYNRGSYLIYQQDRPNKTHGFADDDHNTEWQATARSFIEHFKSNDIRHKFIRRPDFATMISFIKSGKKVYSFFIEYFENLSDDKLIECSFNEQYTLLLEKNNINLESRKKELISLLNELKKELRNHLK